LGAKPKANEPNPNDKYLSSFVIVDESVGNNTSNSPTMGNIKVLCENKKIGSCVLLENSGSDMGEDNKWNVVEVSSKKDIWCNHYVPSSLKPRSSLNHFGSKGKSTKHFVW